MHSSFFSLVSNARVSWEKERNLIYVWKKKKKSDLCTKRLDKMYQVNHNLKKLVHGEHMPIVLYLFDSLGHLTLIPTLIR